MIHPPLTKPFSPAEALKNKINTLPPEVIQVVNTLLSERYDGHTASFTQTEVIARIKKVLPNKTESELIDMHWLDFEPLYRKEGWSVEYDKPGYNESYDASWKFKKATKPRQTHTDRDFGGDK